MKSMDYDSIKNNLKEFACKILNNYKKEYGIKNICGFGIYSDKSAMTICVALNRYDYFKNAVKDDPENECDYKFNPEEWATTIENEELDKLNKILEEIHFNIKRNNLLNIGIISTSRLLKYWMK